LTILFNISFNPNFRFQSNMTIENKYLLLFKKQLRERFPKLFAYGASLYFRTFKFSVEKAYMKGELKSTSMSPSLLLLSCNRAATQLVEDILRRIYERDKGQYIALNRYLFFFDRSEEEPFLDANKMSSMMKPEGFFFGQQGPFKEHQCFDDYKLVVMCRDPRDLLVSHFFSFSQAHVPKDDKFVQKVKEAREMGLQKYVLLEENIEYFESCLAQAIKLRNQSNVLFWKYEDMMDDFNSFQEACQNHIRDNVDDVLSEELNELHKPAVKTTADNTRHRRSGAWGQFKKALDADTIETLNQRFAPYLEELGYPV